VSLVLTDVGLSRNLAHEDGAVWELAGWLGVGTQGGPGQVPWYALWLRGQAPRPAHPRRWYSAAWQARAGWESVEAHGLGPAEHLARCREFAADGFRPAALTVADVGNSGAPPVTASVWHRPVVPEADREALASRQANAAVALLRLGEPERLW